MSVLEIELKDYERLQRALRDFADLRADELMRGVGTEAESQTRRRITNEKKSPDGKPWAQWSSGYAKARRMGWGRDKLKRKRRPLAGQESKVMLTETGRLLDSITNNANADSVEIGSGERTAGFHQRLRPYLGLSRENEADIVGVVNDFIEARARRAGL